MEILLPERFRKGHARMIATFAGAGGRPRTMAAERVVHALRSNGEEFPVEASISVSTGRGGERLMTVIMRDVTERHRDRDALVRSNLELQRFAFVASHDLRTPIASVKGCLGLLAHRFGSSDPKARDILSRATAALDHMDRLTADLLDYARVQARQKPLVLVECGEAVADALRLLQSAIDEVGADVSVAPLPLLEADREQLVQLFQNLVSNALKYRSGRPEIRIGAEEQEDAWLFRVSDNGIGIEPQHHERIFQIFNRLHSASQYPGTGIGLAVCQRVVERHRGRIWVESRPGEGSTFHFTIAKDLGRSDEPTIH
jgi:light-regulated signal transduction histidine kinase (bacteriophytochrome)